MLPKLTQYEQDVLAARAALKNSPPTKTLGIDPGKTNVALCLLDNEHQTHFSTKIEVPKTLQTTAAKLRYVEFVVEQWVSLFRPQLICKEAAALGAEFGGNDMGKFQYLVERVAIDFDLPVLTVNNSSMRAFLKSKEKKASKSDVKLKVWQRYGIELPSEDETDAFAIAKTGEAIIAGTYVVNSKGK